MRLAHDTRLDDIFAATRAKWEADEPGRAERAEAARQQYLKRVALAARGLPSHSTVPVEGAEPVEGDAADTPPMMAERVAMLGHAADDARAETEATREQKRATLPPVACVVACADTTSVLSASKLAFISRASALSNISS